jgi:hypothetical protein
LYYLLNFYGIISIGGIPVPYEMQNMFLPEDRAWCATAMLHGARFSNLCFTPSEILAKLISEGLDQGVPHTIFESLLEEGCIANAAPSSGDTRMLYQESPGMLRLFRPGDETHSARAWDNKPSRSLPNWEMIPSEYRYLLRWYELWTREHTRQRGQDDR